MISIPDEIRQKLYSMLNEMSTEEIAYSFDEFSLVSTTIFSITHISLLYNYSTLFFIYKDNPTLLLQEVALRKNKIISRTKEYEYDITNELTKEDIFNFNISNPLVLNFIKSFNKLSYKDFVIEYLINGYCCTFKTDSNYNIRNII